MVNMTGAVLGGMVDQQNKVAEQQARNRQLDIAQQGADTQRMGVANQQLQFGQRLALERMNATLEQMRQIKANLQSPADMPRVAGTMQELAKDVVLLAQAGGFDPQAAINQVQAVMAGTQTVSEAAQNKGTAQNITDTVATPGATRLAGAVAGAQEAARAANAAPQVLASVSNQGHQILTFVQNGQVSKQVDVGSVKNPLDLGRFRADVALRSQGKEVSSPEVQALSPNEALAVNSVFADQNPLNTFISNALGGGKQADVVGPLADRIAKGGQISTAEWGSLSAQEQAALTARVKQLKVGPPAAGPGLGSSALTPATNPLGNLENPAEPAVPMAQ
jgi:hypothetical protein